MNESQTVIEGWAIVELFGHNKIAGYVTTAIIGTSGMLRVDIPEIEDMPAYTRFYGPGAVYSLTLVTEEIARAALLQIRPEAVTVYIPKQLSMPVTKQREEDEAYRLGRDEFSHEGEDEDDNNYDEGEDLEPTDQY